MLISNQRLGYLERVDPRLAWPSEANHFTPWLAQAENLRLLGDTIGIDLELEATETNVGSFRADILCKDTISGNRVLIENQLDRTDHSHLGQLITYASGLKAVTIVWIANPFTEEHRAALDWLNQVTDNKLNFFGLEVELWRIGDSPVAPKFNMVCKPNDWSKTVAASTARLETETLTEAKQLQLQFWTGFRDFAQTKSSLIKPTKPLPQNWMNIAIGRSGFNLTAVASLWDSETSSYDKNEVRAELSINGEHAKNYFLQLEAEKADIETQLGFPLTWYSPDNSRVCRIFVRKTAILRNQGQWPELYRWLLDNLESLHRIFARRVRQLTEIVKPN